MAYVVPKKEIMRVDDMQKWEKSEAYFDFLGFMMAMNEAVKNKKISDISEVPKIIQDLCGLVETMEGWIAEFPPQEQPQRFGNKAFRDWFAKLETEAPNLVRNVLPEEYHPSVVEISVYLVESVGNSTRIDYGTGHELAFAVFLFCLFKIGLLKEEDSAAVILKVFDRYLNLVRKLQTSYNMEPAGSHGVWSLDDFQFLPFIWGSSQLIGQQILEPSSFTKPEIVNERASDYLFFGCIKFINKVKTGPFAEHSNQLWNISAVQTWNKVNSGLIKMYKAEVLGKFPVIQHLLFGSLLSIAPADPAKVQSVKLPR